MDIPPPMWTLPYKEATETRGKNSWPFWKGGNPPTLKVPPPLSIKDLWGVKRPVGNPIKGGGDKKSSRKQTWAGMKS